MARAAPDGWPGFFEPGVSILGKALAPEVAPCLLSGPIPPPTREKTARKSPSECHPVWHFAPI